MNEMQVRRSPIIILNMLGLFMKAKFTCMNYTLVAKRHESDKKEKHMC